MANMSRKDLWAKQDLKAFGWDMLRVLGILAVMLLVTRHFMH